MTIRLKPLAVIAMAAAMAACSKQEPLSNEGGPAWQDEELFEVTIIAENPEAAPATKTEMNGTKPYWSVGDRIGVSNGTSTNRQFSTGITAASLSATFTGTTAVEGELYAYYPYSSLGVSTKDGTTGALFELPSEQNPTASSFDGAADMMVSRPFTVSPSGKTVSGLEFTRLGAIVRIVLKDKDGVMGSGQHPSSVSISAASSLAGRLVIDMQNQSIGSIYYNAANTVTANYTAETQYAIDGTAGAYLIVYPQTLEEGSSLKIEAVTEDYTISKTITVPQGGIKLLPGKVNTLNISLASEHITAKASSQEFRLFSGDIEEGDYIIAYSGVAMKAAISSSRFEYTGYSLVDDAIFNPDPSIVWHIAASGSYWTVYNSTVGKYAASTGAKNVAQLLTDGSDDKSLWTISGSSVYEIVNKQNSGSGVNANLRYNPGVGFACYSTGTGGALTLYKLVSDPTETPDPVMQEFTDELLRETTGVANGSTTYAPWTASGSASTAAYSGMSAGGNNSIQLRSSGNNSGIVSTVSGGRLKKVSVTWQEGTTNGRVLNVYGNNTAYSDPAELFASGTEGTLLGTIVCGTSTELEIEGDYAYVGIRSNSGALYLSSVEITWESDTGGSGGSTGSDPVSVNPALQYLGCIEVPELSLANTASYTATGTETFGSTPWFAYNSTVSTRRVATHTYSFNSSRYRNYTVMVDKDKRCPLWVAYPMHKSAYPSNSLGRVGSFSTETSYDPAFERSWQSSGSTSDYNDGNGYARGHLCASADRQAIEEANEQTFYYTNQAPQWQNSFNSGVWSSLEDAVRENAPSASSDTLYVVSGVLFDPYNSGSSNDGGTVARPSHFYKCLMKCTFSGEKITAASGVAYIYTNEAHSGVSYSNASFLTTIDAIEELSGFNFFPSVPADLQTAAENSSTPLW